MGETKTLIGSVPTYMGTWQSGKEYYKDNLVHYQGSAFICIAETTTSELTDNSAWEVFVQSNITPSGDPMHYAYESVGAVWNPESGYWEMNGLTDLTNEDMRTTYSYGRPTQLASRFAYAVARTIIPMNSSWTWEYFSMEKYFYSCFTLESVYLMARPTGMKYTFAGCEDLKKVLGMLRMDLATINQSFHQCKKLEYIRLFNLKSSVEFLASTNLGTDSVAYMIENAANTSAITITLHATAYANAIADEQVQSALEAHPLVTLASA